jgi:hypothetical protein
MTDKNNVTSEDTVREHAQDEGTCLKKPILVRPLSTYTRSHQTCTKFEGFRVRVYEKSVFPNVLPPLFSSTTLSLASGDLCLFSHVIPCTVYYGIRDSRALKIGQCSACRLIAERQCKQGPRTPCRRNFLANEHTFGT